MKTKVRQIKLKRKHGDTATQVKEIRVTADNDQKLSVNQINQWCNTIQQELINKKFSGEVQITLISGTRPIATGPITIGRRFRPITIQNINIDYDQFIDDEYDALNHPDAPLIDFFTMYVIYRSRAGGCIKGNYNNCLEWCLMRSHVFSVFPSYREFRQAIDVAPGLPIPIDKIPEIEPLVKTNINVTGDFNYHSQGVYPKTIHVVLRDGHYSINEQIKGHLKPKKYNYERDVVVYRNQDDLGMMKECWTQNGYVLIHKDKIYSHYAIGYKKIAILMRPKIDHTLPLESQKITTKPTLEQAYDWIMDQMTKVKTITEGKINMFKTGWIPETIRYQLMIRWNNFHLQEVKITAEELSWLHESQIGQYTACKPGDYHDVYGYDIKSNFVAVLADSTFNIPINTGQFLTITTENFNKSVESAKSRGSGFKYGIYRANVMGDHPFFLRRKQMYCHIDLLLACLLGLDVEIIEDGQPNFLYYEHRIKSPELFGDYIDLIFPYKKAHPEVLMFKLLSSSIHGAILQKRILHTYKVGGDQDTEITICDDEQPFDFVKINDNVTSIKTHNPNFHYLCQLARLGPFLYAKQRMGFYNIFYKHYGDRIIRANTDSIWVEGMIPEFEHCSGKLGSVYQEKFFKKLHLKSLNTYTYEL